MAITWFEDSFSLWFPKKQLTYEGLKYGVADYVHNKLRTTLNAFFQGQRGFFTYDVVVSSLSTTEFSITENDSGTNVISGMADDEKVFSVTSGDAEITSIPWENTAAVVYSVGIRPQQEVPDFSQDHIRRNAISGKYKYTLGRDRIGEYVNGMTVLSGADAAKTVAVDGDKLVICVDELWEFQGASTESSSHAGVTVYAWLVQPESLDNTVAFKSATVQYGTDTTNSVGYFAVARNFIELDAATGTTFGATSADIAYTNVALFYHGPTITRKTWKDLSADTAYAWVGEITGHAATPTFSNTGQVLLRPNTLDWAYDGPSGSGSGRAITADSGAVTIDNVEDDATSCLELTRDSGTTQGSALKVTVEDSTASGLTDALELVSGTGAPDVKMRVAITNTPWWGVYQKDAAYSLLEQELVTSSPDRTRTILGENLSAIGDISELHLGGQSQGIKLEAEHISSGQRVLDIHTDGTHFARFYRTSTAAYLYLSPDFASTFPVASAARIEFGNGSEGNSIRMERAGGGAYTYRLHLVSTQIASFGETAITLDNPVTCSDELTIGGDLSYSTPLVNTVVIPGQMFIFDDVSGAGFKYNNPMQIQVVDADNHDQQSAHIDLRGYLPPRCTITSVAIQFLHDATDTPTVHQVSLNSLSGSDMDVAVTNVFTQDFKSETTFTGGHATSTWTGSAAYTQSNTAYQLVYAAQNNAAISTGGGDQTCVMFGIVITFSQTYID